VYISYAQLALLQSKNLENGDGKKLSNSVSETLIYGVSKASIGLSNSKLVSKNWLYHKLCKVIDREW